jgi:putative alpha-1,2-mannosidase
MVSLHAPTQPWLSDWLCDVPSVQRRGQFRASRACFRHVLYVFAAAGRPDRTQFWFGAYYRSLYTKDTFPGDEDTDAMAAWLVLSSLGLHSAYPGRPDYTLGSPLFDRTTLHLPGGAALVIEAKQNSATNVFVPDICFNDEAYTAATIDHSAIAKGGKTTFQTCLPKKARR